MFTPDGRLRDEFVADETPAAEPLSPAPAAASASPEPAATPAPVRAAAEEPEPPAYAEPPLGSGPRLELPGAPPGTGPTFYDLVAVLAEPISIYLGDLALPSG